MVLQVVLHQMVLRGGVAAILVNERNARRRFVWRENNEPPIQRRARKGVRLDDFPKEAWL